MKVVEDYKDEKEYKWQGWVQQDMMIEAQYV
jgi:hypothetical protein